MASRPLSPYGSRTAWKPSSKRPMRPSRYIMGTSRLPPDAEWNGISRVRRGVKRSRPIAFEIHRIDEHHDLVLVQSVDDRRNEAVGGIVHPLVDDVHAIGRAEVQRRVPTPGKSARSPAKMED